jgi:hypothetical protein
VTTNSVMKCFFKKPWIGYLGHANMYDNLTWYVYLTRYVNLTWYVNSTAHRLSVTWQFKQLYVNLTCYVNQCFGMLTYMLC